MEPTGSPHPGSPTTTSWRTEKGWQWDIISTKPDMPKVPINTVHQVCDCRFPLFPPSLVLTSLLAIFTPVVRTWPWLISLERRLISFWPWPVKITWGALSWKCLCKWHGTLILTLVVCRPVSKMAPNHVRLLVLVPWASSLTWNWSDIYNQ